MSSPNNDVFSLDPHCLDCSYNLRGHAGDPIRCPECGHVNSVEDLEVPANLIRKALRRLETGAALCGASAATLLWWVVPLSIVMVNPPLMRAPAFVRVFVTTLGVAAMVLYVVGMIRFRRSCGCNSRWLPTLLWFTTLACLIAAAILSAMAAVISCIPIVMDLWPAFPINIQVVARLGAVILLLALSTWLYRVAKRAIHPLQRETAARLARARYGSNP